MRFTYCKTVEYQPRAQGDLFTRTTDPDIEGGKDIGLRLVSGLFPVVRSVSPGLGDERIVHGPE